MTAGIPCKCFLRASSDGPLTHDEVATIDILLGKCAVSGDKEAWSLN